MTKIGYSSFFILFFTDLNVSKKFYWFNHLSYTLILRKYRINRIQRITISWLLVFSDNRIRRKLHWIWNKRIKIWYMLSCLLLLLDPLLAIDLKRADIHMALQTLVWGYWLPNRCYQAPLKPCYKGEFGFLQMFHVSVWLRKQPQILPR